MNKVFTTVLLYKVQDKDKGKTVEQILKREFKISSGLFTELKLNGKIFINGEKCISIDKPEISDTVSADIEENKVSEIPECDIEPNILFEDAHIIVVNKPAGLSMHPCRGDYKKTLAGGIIHHWRKNNEEHNFHAVNRLDKNTSGICVIAKNRYSHAMLSGQLRNNETKEYKAIVHGKIDDCGIIELPIKIAEDSIIKRIVSEDGKNAITVYTSLESGEKYSLVKIKLLTGRTHQIRVHFSHTGHPLFGDWLYGSGDNEGELIKRQALVASRIKFIHPVSKEPFEFNVDLPDDMKMLLQKLK